MKAKRFYKNDISISNEYIVFESPSYSNEKLVYVGVPSAEDRALVRSYFFEELDRLNVDILTASFNLVKVKKQHYIITEVVYNGEFLSFERELDTNDFILLSNGLFIVFIKKPSFTGNLVLNVNFYDFQPHVLFVNEFTAKNFTSNPSSKITSSSLYVSGIVGLDKDGNAVYYGRFSQPVLLNEAYVFLQKLLIPTYSFVPKGGPGFFGVGNINISLYYPSSNVSNVDVFLYHPSVSDPGNLQIDLYSPDITDEEDITVIVDVVFLLAEDGAFAVNLHDDVAGEVGIISSITSYKLISTTSIFYGGVDVEGLYVYYLDYYNDNNTVSIYRYDVTSQETILFLTFSNMNSQTFSSLQFDKENRIFFVLANNGTYFISLSNPIFVTFSDYFGVNGRYLSYNFVTGSGGLGTLYYTDDNTGIKSAIYTNTSPYIYPPTLSFLNTLSDLSFFDTPKSYTQIYYVTRSSSFNVLKVDYSEGVIYSTSNTMSAICRLVDDSASAISHQSGSSFAVYIVQEELAAPDVFSVSLTFVGLVPKFVREIKHFTSSAAISEFDIYSTISTYDAFADITFAPNDNVMSGSINSGATFATAPNDNVLVNLFNTEEMETAPSALFRQTLNSENNII